MKDSTAPAPLRVPYSGVARSEQYGEVSARPGSREGTKRAAHP